MLVWWVMGLENIVEKFFDRFFKPAAGLVRLACAHPKTTGLLSAFASAYYLGGSENSPFVAGIGVSAFCLTSLVKEYVFGDKEVVLPEANSGLVKKAECFVFNNPKIFASLYGLAVASYFAFSPVKSEDFTFLKSLNNFGSIHFLLANSFLYLRRNNEFFARAYKKLKSDHSVVRAVDYVFERPVIPAAVAGIGSLAWLFSQSAFGLKNYSSLTLGFAAISCINVASGAYALDVLASSLFHSSSLKLFKENAKLFWYSFIKDYDSAEDICRNLLDVPSSSGKKAVHYLHLANLYFDQHKMDSGLLNLQESLSLAKQDTKELTPYEWIREFLLFDKICDVVRLLYSDSSDDEPVRSLNLAAYHFKWKKFARGLQDLDVAVKESEAPLGPRIVRAGALDMLDSAKADNSWKEILSDVILMHKDKFKRISFTSKEVLELVFDELLANNFIFARSSGSKALKKEHDISRFVYACYEDKRIVPKPYFFTEGNGKAYSVHSRINGALLSEISLTEEDIMSSLGAYFDFCFRTTANRQSLARFSAEVPEIGYLNFYAEKFLDRVPGDTNLKDRLFKNFLPVARRLANRSRHLIHGNYHPANIIKGDSLCVIDFGDACFANICFGVEQLLGHELIHHPDKASVHKKAHDFMEGVSKDGFLEDCALSSVFVGAHMLGRSIYFNEGSHAYYQKNVFDAVNFLVENFVSGKDKDSLLFYADDVCTLDVN